jgi:hypothetical protein
MSDEKIQIEIQDKVAPSIESKLDGITASARSGYDAVERLKSALSRMDSGALNALTLANNRAQKAMNDAALSSQRLRTEEQKTTSATIAAATAQQKLQTAATQTASAQQALATATARTATEQARSATAASNAAAAQSRAAGAALRLEQQQARAAQAFDSTAYEAEQLKRSLFPLYDAQVRYNDAVNRANLLLSQGAIEINTYHAAIDRAKGKLDAATAASNMYTAAQNRMGKSAQINRAHLTNLGFQLNDIGVSLAGGQNPLLVLVQQGSQIAGIASQAGVGLGALAKAAGSMLARFIPLATIIGGVVAGINMIATEAGKGANLEKYARDLGATSKQIKKLDLDTVTFGDTMRGLFKTIDNATGISGTWDKITSGARTAFLAVLKTIAGAVISIIALFQASFAVVVNLWETFPNRFGLFIGTAVNRGIDLFEEFTNAAINGVNAVIEALNAVSGTKIKPFENLKFDRVDTSAFETGAKDLADVFVDSYVESLDKNGKAVMGFIVNWQKNSLDAAKKRIKEALADDKTSENRAAALAKINAQLDNELDRMFKLRPEREAQARFDQIEEQLIGRKIKLTEAEATAIKQKIAAIEKAKVVQQQFDKLYDQAVGPAREFNATLEAAQRLLTSNPELQDRVNRSLIQAREAYLNQLDPLREINKEIDQQNALLDMLPGTREVSQQLQQIENQLLGEGIVLTKEQSAALLERLYAQQALNIQSQAEAAIWENTRGARETYIAQLNAINRLKKEGTITGGEAAQQVIATNTEFDFSNTQTQIDARVTQFEDMYSRIQQLRDRELINEQTAAALRAQVWAASQASQLETASSFFTQMSQLQKSENSKAAAIGKAAAIAQAIVDTYKGATSAYASMAGIPYVGPALGIAAAAAAIAAGLANVQAIRSQPTGFMQGGYTGDGATNAVAGAVHGREYVMDAATTSRLGVNNLDALRSGAAQVQSGGPAGGSGDRSKAQSMAPPVNVNMPFTAIVVPSRESALAAMASAEGKALVLETIEENGTTVARIVGTK